MFSIPQYFLQRPKLSVLLLLILLLTPTVFYLSQPEDAPQNPLTLKQPLPQEKMPAAPAQTPAQEAKSTAQHTLRNPFLAPGAGMARNKTALSRSGAPNLPVLRGIVTGNGSSMAIIEYNNLSASYKTGDKINGYTITGIDSRSVQLVNTSSAIRLTLD